MALNLDQESNIVFASLADSAKQIRVARAAGAAVTEPTTSQNLLQQPGIIAAIVGGGIAACLLFVLLVLFCVYRLRKKDEGSYALDEPKKAPVASAYTRAPTREFYA